MENCASYNKGSVQTALNNGHKLGFVGGTDNHSGWPTLLELPGNKSIMELLKMYKEKVSFPSQIYTGVWARSRSRSEVYKALFSRHTWACWDTRAIVWVTINGVLQGGELKVRKGANLEAYIKMSVEAPLDVLEIVSRDGVVWSFKDPGSVLDIEKHVDLGMISKDSYYYLRARQKNGALIYASPVFVCSR